MNWTPLNLTVRVGCHLAYETTVPTPVLFVLKPRLEGRVLVMQEKLSFGIGLPSYEFQDSYGSPSIRASTSRASGPSKSRTARTRWMAHSQRSTARPRSLISRFGPIKKTPSKSPRAILWTCPSALMAA